VVFSLKFFFLKIQWKRMEVKKMKEKGNVKKQRVLN